MKVALIVMARYLSGTDPAFADHLVQSFRHAEAVGLSKGDLDMLRMMAGAIGERL